MCFVFCMKTFSQLMLLEIGQIQLKLKLQRDVSIANGGKCRTGGWAAEATWGERGETVQRLCAGHQTSRTMRLDVNTCCCGSICQKENEWEWKLCGKSWSCMLADKAVNWRRPLLGPMSLFLLEAEIHKHLWQASVQPTALLLLEHHLRALICISTGTLTNATGRRQAPDETRRHNHDIKPEKNRPVSIKQPVKVPFESVSPYFSVTGAFSINHWL